MASPSDLSLTDLNQTSRAAHVTPLTLFPDTPLAQVTPSSTLVQDTPTFPTTSPAALQELFGYLSRAFGQPATGESSRQTAPAGVTRQGRTSGGQVGVCS